MLFTIHDMARPLADNIFGGAFGFDGVVEENSAGSLR